MRSVFVMPPFAMVIMFLIIAKDSLHSNFENLKLVMKKRRD
jgi:hypothetical protein